MLPSSGYSASVHRGKTMAPSKRQKTLTERHGSLDSSAVYTFRVKERTRESRFKYCHLLLLVVVLTSPEVVGKILWIPEIVCCEQNGRIRSYKRVHWSGCNTRGWKRCHNLFQKRRDEIHSLLTTSRLS